MSNLVVTSSYGPAVTLEQAKKIAVGAAAEAKKNNWNVVIAVVDTHGFLKYYEMMDDTQTASATVAIEKARTAAMFRRPTKMFEDAIAGGRHAILGMPGVAPLEGGLPDRDRRQSRRGRGRERPHLAAGRAGRAGRARHTEVNAGAAGARRQCAHVRAALLAPERAQR